MILLTLAAACSSPQFTQEWLVDRTRVLAVRAEPAEAAVGAIVTLSALVVDPVGDPAVAWVACSVPVDCPDYVAVQQLAAADTSAMTPDELAAWQADAAAAGFLGFGVGLSPTLVIMGAGPPDGLPDTGLPGSTDSGTLPASSEVTLVLEALPAGKALADVTLGDPEATEITTKSISLTNSEEPNQNPKIDSLHIDGTSAATVSRGEIVPLKATLVDGSSESYVDEDGETQTEDPTVSYYVSGGTLMQSSAPADEAEVSWTAPEVVGTVKVWAIARDGRGGMDWLAATVTVD